MGQIMFSSNPNDWQSLDGVYINEVSPPSKVMGINSGIVGIIGEFERGPEDASGNPLIGSPSSAQDLVNQFGGRGANNQWLGYLGMANKKFGTLRVRRVTPASMARAALALKDTATTTVINVQGNSMGAWANNVTIQTGPGTKGAGYIKITVTYNPVSPGVLSDTEVFDNIPTSPASQAALNAALGPKASGNGYGASKYVNFVWAAAGVGLATIAATALAAGSDGAATSTDYSNAITAFEVLSQQDVVILCVANPPDALRTAINTALATHAQNYPGQLVIVAGQSGDSVSAAVTARQSVGSMQNLIYTFNHTTTTLSDGTVVTVGPETWMASIRSQQLPEQSAADGDTAVQFLQGISGVLNPNLQRSDYVTLRANGIAGIAPYDPDVGGYKFYSSVNTYQPVALGKGTDEGMIERKHLHIYCDMSVARRLKQFNNKPLPLNADGSISPDHLQVLGEVQTFFGDLAKDKRIVGANVDAVNGNTPSGLASGQFVLVTNIKRAPNADIIVVRSACGASVSLST